MVSGANQIGGIVGDIASGSSLTNATFTTGSVTGSGNYVGGIAGDATSASIQNASFTGSSVNGGNYVGGIAGNGLSATIRNAFFNGTLTGDTLGGIIAYGRPANIASLYYLSANGLNGVGTEADTTEINGLDESAFKDGLVAWSLRNYQDGHPDLFSDNTKHWGQTTDPNPILTTDTNKNVYRLSLYTSDTVNNQLNAWPYDYLYLNADTNANLVNPPDIEPSYIGFHWVDANGKIYSNNASENYVVLSDDSQALYLLKAPDSSEITLSTTVLNDQEDAELSLSDPGSNALYQISNDNWCTVISGAATCTPPTENVGLNHYKVKKKSAPDDVWSPATEVSIYCLETDTIAHKAVQIKSIEDLTQFSTYINDGDHSINNAILTGNLACNNISLTPIGSITHPYTGCFDGQNFIISDFTITSSSDNTGFFGNINAATIKNLTLSGTVDASNYNDAGGIVGRAENNSMIESCLFSGFVTGTENIGGITGKSIDSTIKNCQAATALINGSSDDVGGISGHAVNTAISGCCFKGSVTGRNNLGGIVGYLISNANLLDNCCVNADLKSNNNGIVGGLIGFHDGTASISIKNSYFNGEIINSGTCGGIAGFVVPMSSLENNYFLSDGSHNPGLMAVGSGSLASATATTQEAFADGSVAWALQNGQLTPSMPVWGQTITGSAPTASPILTTDPNQHVHRVCFYNNDGSTILYTRYTNSGQRLNNYPSPGNTYVWLNGDSQFTDLSLISADLTVIQTATMSVSVDPVTTTAGNRPDYNFAGLPDGAIISYSLDGSNFDDSPPTFTKTGFFNITFNISATGYQDFRLSTTVTVNSGGGGTITPPPNGEPDPPTPQVPEEIILTPNLDDVQDGSSSPGSSGNSFPQALSATGFGTPYSYDIDAALPSGSTASKFALSDVSDPCGILADGNGSPAISEAGIFSCILNYIPGAPCVGSVLASTSKSLMMMPVDSDPSIAEKTALTSDGDNITKKKLTATVIIDITYQNGDTIPLKLIIEVVDRSYSIAYRTHIENIGWEDCFAENGDLSGTEGMSLRLESIQIKTESDYDLELAYRTHIENQGWEEDTVNSGSQSGTEGLGLRLEAIELSLAGSDADYFDIYYQVHVQNIGWLDWAKNGQAAGSAGFGYRLEGVHIILLPKGSETPGPTEKHFIEQ